MNRFIRNIIIGATLIIMYSCAQNPEFIKIDNIVVKGIKDSLMEVHMDYVVFNPNNVKTKLKQSGMSLYYKDAYVGEGFLENQISLKPNDTIRVPVLCNIKLDKLSKFYPEMLISDTTAFNIKGENKIGFLFNSFTIDVDEKIYLNTREIIKKEINKNLGNTSNFRIKTVSINSLPTLDKTNFKITILAKNNLDFDYEIHQMELQFFLDDKAKEPIANWSQDKVISQKALSSTEIPLEVVVDNMNTLKNSSVTMLFKKEIDFIVVGQVQIKIQNYVFDVPINDNMKMDIKKFIGL
ncbi:hypothetical protein FF125_07830 [Aureibaculum algae]|uniref:Late embryogenesis abundant protein LEA-2 subgroup domain-containing protein n=1 Tax=Aureibaculum algae TaxID=2584122 RepID=A0A5B7TSZ7_9FLAO|nr:hypothetical protein [Aureibaculum algae]QCX38344.1 hypothetical protein FF125_07830 [Aureibaculum algae]